MKFSEIAQILHSQKTDGIQEEEILGYSIDSRTLQKGDLFFAIVGEHFDGHHFLLEAQEKNAAGFVLDQRILEEASYRENFSDDFLQKIERLPNVIYVPDTVKALQDLAKQVAQKLPAKKIAVTGSCGKTTVKELLGFLLKQNYTVEMSAGNLNNHLGLPLSLLRANPQCDFYVAELGASQKKDIQFLCDILQPDIGILTNVSKAHLESFGSLQDVYETKLELAEYLSSKEGAFIWDQDDETISSYIEGLPLKKISVGFSKKADFCLTDSCHFDAILKLTLNDKRTFYVQQETVLNPKNVLQVLACASVCGMSFPKESILFHEFRPPKGRFSVSKMGGYTLINDSYNANPASFQNALKLFDEMYSEGRRLIVCGEMLELGEEEKKCHQEVGELINRMKIELVIGIGERGRWITDSISNTNTKTRAAQDQEEALHFLLEELQEKDMVLFKASRGVQLEKLIQEVQKQIKQRGAMHAV